MSSHVPKAHGATQRIPAGSCTPNELMSQPRNTEFGEFIAFIASGSKPVLFPGENVTSSLKVAYYKHNLEKWPEQRAIKALHC